MSKRIVAVIAVTAVVSMLSAAAFASCGMCGAGETKTKDAAAPIKVNNTVCPITGNAVDMKSPITVDYKGKTYNLCCPMCVEAFKSNPEKYSKAAETQVKNIGK